MKAVRRSLEPAFTLMEMILVLAIISLLLGMGTYTMVNVIFGAEEAKARADIKAIESGLMQYRTAGGLLPTESQGLASLVSKPVDGPQPKRYKRSFRSNDALIDPWTRPYQYRIPGVKNPDGFDLFSLGKDGKEGTEDDVGNWE